MKMLLDDTQRRAIEWDCTRLVYTYANLNDAADWNAVAGLYIEYGSMTRPTAPDLAIIGREAILAAFLNRPPRTTRHVCANVVIDVIDADHASGSSVVLLFAGAAPPMVGGFTDRFVRTTAGWRFEERRAAMTFGP